MKLFCRPVQMTIMNPLPEGSHLAPDRGFVEIPDEAYQEWVDALDALVKADARMSALFRKARESHEGTWAIEVLPAKEKGLT